MTNKVDTIVSAISTKLISAGLKTVYRYPEAHSKIGNRFPLAVIREDRQDFTLTSGQRYEYNLYITIVLVSDAIRERMKTMNDLQVTVFNALFQDCTLSGNVMNIEPISVDTGNMLGDTVLEPAAGWNEGLTYRTITLQCLVQDTRY